MEGTTKRTCVKCRAHGKCVLLKNHKQNCPYQRCACERCSAHDNNKEQKRKASQSELNMSAQTVLDVAQVDLSSKVVSKNMSATDKKLGKHQGIFGGLYAFLLSVYLLL